MKWLAVSVLLKHGSDLGCYEMVWQFLLHYFYKEHLSIFWRKVNVFILIVEIFALVNKILFKYGTENNMIIWTGHFYIEEIKGN